MFFATAGADPPPVFVSVAGLFFASVTHVFCDGFCFAWRSSSGSGSGSGSGSNSSSSYFNLQNDVHLVLWW